MADENKDMERKKSYDPMNVEVIEIIQNSAIVGSGGGGGGLPPTPSEDDDE